MDSNSKKYGPWLLIYRIALSLIAAWILYVPPPPPTAIEIITESMERQRKADIQKIVLTTQVSDQAVPEIFRYEHVASNQDDIEYFRRSTDGEFTCITIGYQNSRKIYIKDEAGWREDSTMEQCFILDGILAMALLQYRASIKPQLGIMSGYVVQAGNERLENRNWADTYEAKSWVRQGSSSDKQLHSKIWIATDTMLPHKIEIVDETAERRSTHILRLSYPAELNIENPCVEGC